MFSLNLTELPSFKCVERSDFIDQKHGRSSWLFRGGILTTGFNIASRQAPVTVILKTKADIRGSVAAIALSVHTQVQSPHSLA